jgi:transposase
MKRPKINSETKMTAVLERLRGESSIADIYRKEQIRESFYYRGRDKFWEAGSRALAPGLPAFIKSPPNEVLCKNV